MSTKPSHTLDGELQDLWSRRANLDEPEWTRLYTIICEALIPYRPAELAGLKEEREVYVQEFFEDKVFRPELLSRLDHVGALKFAYRNFLRDRIRNERSSLEEEYVQGDPEDEDVNARTDEVATDGESCEDEFLLLREAGVNPEYVDTVAQTWIANAESWVPVYLGMHFCQDAERSEALYRLAKRMRIASYHYKAERLGITGNFEDDYGNKTMIGRWIVEDLGIEINRDNRLLVLAALKILCFQALNWAEQQEAAS